MKVGSSPTVGLDPGMLDALARAVREVGREQRGVAFLPLAVLAGRLSGVEAVSVDYTQARRLDAPLVVVRVRNAPSPGMLANLTPRERVVARQLASGASNKAIARALGIAPGTVKLHVHRILRKTGFASRAAFAAARVAE